MSMSIPGIVQSFEWVGKPIAVQFGERSLEMNATPKTDWFTDPETSQVMATASALVCRPKTEFILSAKVDVSFATAFDAGALVLWSNTQSCGEALLRILTTRPGDGRLGGHEGRVRRL